MCRWPHILVVLSYAEKVLEYFDFQTQVNPTIPVFNLLFCY
jgi:hypothetical protein